MTDPACRVRLDAFEGPLDLLLHLIREHEIDIHDIPIAQITEQYLDSLKELQRINVELAGEFLLMAATLMEIKSRMIALASLPKDGPRQETHDEADPRADLVAQLLAYKKYRDAADELEERARRWAMRHPAAPIAVPDLTDTDDALDLEDLHMQDLVDAFARIISAVNLDRLGEHEVVDDDTPIELHAEDIVDLLRRNREPMTLREALAGRTRVQMIGMFIAMLELVRQRRLAVTQEKDDIILSLREPEEAGEPAPADETQDNTTSGATTPEPVAADETTDPPPTQPAV